ncbi:MAG: hypothetical protein RMI93_02275 [Caldimicrobium sp.]|nr:hypothetical protein [Caldimicrobium sp.]MDW8182418.1 hypothetical protein [Caldimicrobium sp.]
MGLIPGNVLGLKITSPYLRDLPTYAKIYTMDEEVENLVWKAMKLIIDLTDCYFIPWAY